MSRWFRHYAGMMRDEKLVSAAVKSKQPVERVVWVWGAILESASEINDNGRYEFDAGEAAYFLRCDDADLVGILACLESLGRLSGGLVVRWGDRQYSSDTAAERQRRYRERKSANATVHGYGRDDKRDSDVTVTSRDGDVTPQETDTELETERVREPLTPSKPKRYANPCVVLQAVVDPMTAQRYVGYLEEKRKPLVSATAEMLVETLREVQRLGGNATEALHLAIKKGWLGLEVDHLRNAGLKFTQAAPAPTIDWSARVDAFVNDGVWPMGWGPRPGDPGCEAPAELIRKIAA